MANQACSQILTVEQSGELQNVHACRYMPAELLMEGKMTKAADVYSFAMLMFELLTGNQLFESMRQSQVSFQPDLLFLQLHPTAGPRGCLLASTTITMLCCSLSIVVFLIHCGSFLLLQKTSAFLANLSPAWAGD